MIRVVHVTIVTAEHMSELMLQPIHWFSPSRTKRFCTSLMTFAPASQFHVYILTMGWVNAYLALCLNSVLNVKVLVAVAGPSKGLLRYCENRWIVCSSSANIDIALCIMRTVPAHRPLCHCSQHNLYWSPDNGMEVWKCFRRHTPGRQCRLEVMSSPGSRAATMIAHV